jgi:hypothetical protein
MVIVSNEDVYSRQYTWYTPVCTAKTIELRTTTQAFLAIYSHARIFISDGWLQHNSGQPTHVELSHALMNLI